MSSFSTRFDIQMDLHTLAGLQEGTLLFLFLFFLAAAAATPAHAVGRIVFSLFFSLRSESFQGL